MPQSVPGIMVFNRRAVSVALLIIYCTFPSLWLFLIECRATTTKADPYKTLRVDRNASAEEIEKAFRKLAKKYHPDSPTGNDKNFMEVSNAREVLTDPEKRKRYDMHGWAAVDQEMPSGAGFEGGNFGGFPEDIFSEFFGGGFSGGGGAGGFSSGGSGFRFHFSGGPPGGDGGQQQRQATHQRDIYEDSAVPSLNPSKFKTDVENTQYAYLVNFFSPSCSHCVKMKLEYINLKKRFTGIVQIGVINCSQYHSFCSSLSVQGYPTIRLYLAPKGSHPIEYAGERSETAMAKWLNQILPTKAILLTPQNIEKWVTSSPETAKVVVFTDKAAIPLLIRIVSFEFGTRLKIGVVRRTDVEVTKLFSKYDKNVHFPSILNLLDIDKLSGEWIRVAEMSVESLSLAFSLIVAKKRAASGPYGQHVAFKEFTARRMNSGECDTTDGQYCFFLFVYDDQNVIDHVKPVAEKYVRDPIKMSWVDARKQVQFSECFNLPKNCSGANCARFVAYRPKRKKFDSMTNDITTKTVDAFIESVVSGTRMLKSTIKSPPKLVSLKDEL